MLKQAGIVALAGVALVALPLAAEEVPTVDQVLSEYVEAVGGAAAIERLTARICAGRVVTDLSWQDPHVQVERFVAWATVPEGVRIVTEGPYGAVVVEVARADSAWSCAREGAQPREGLARSKLAWLLDPRNAIRTADYFPGLESKGRELIEGREVWILEPSGLDPAYWRLSFDAGTGLLVQIGYYWTLEDYREVDGVLFPFRVTQSRKGGSTTHYFDHVWHETAR